MASGGKPRTMAVDPPSRSGPPLRTIESVFAVYEVRTDGDRLWYRGEPLVEPEDAMSELWPAFREHGYDAQLTRRDGEAVLVAEPTSVGLDGIPWTVLVLFVATVVSTLFAGARWYYIDPIANPGEMWRAWPFTAAILFVLLVHEMGHYVASRYHRVDASLPYFIPVPTLIGTMGAIISVRGRIPDRRALFDIGVAGPLAGLVATIGVTIVGLHLDPVEAPSALVDSTESITIQLGFPPLIELLASAFDRPLYHEDPAVSVNPVVVGAWVGAFVTFLNLIPVGQLDGGHILRAMVGDAQAWLATLVPGALFGLAVYLYYGAGYGAPSILVWVLWGVLAALLAVAGPASPVVDERLGVGRFLLGCATFALGALCFMPVPIEIVT